MEDSLLREVDADVRAERMAVLWRRYRQPVAVFCVVLVLATAAMQWWNHHQEVRGAEWMGQLTRGISLLEKGKAEQAAGEFTAVADAASGDARDIALVWLSRAFVVADKKPEAIAALKKVNLAASSIWSDIACLRLGRAR